MVMRDQFRKVIILERNMETLDKHFRHLSKASFARYGFAYGDLIAQWPAIVGVQLAEHCEPERIRWPKTTGHDDKQAGGVLVIRAAAGRGLELQYEGPQIIERINQFFGYGAITSLKIMQGHFTPKRAIVVAADDPRMMQSLAQKLDGIADDRLREALSRMGRGVLSAAKSSPQGK
jgi:hypothetical protein